MKTSDTADAPWLMMRVPGGLLSMPLAPGDDPIPLAARLAETMTGEKVAGAEWCVVYDGGRTPRWPNPEPWTEVPVAPERDTTQQDP